MVWNSSGSYFRNRELELANESLKFFNPEIDLNGGRGEISLAKRGREQRPNSPQNNSRSI